MKNPCLALMFVLIATTAVIADTFTVCLDGTCDFTDIQEAINTASNGDTIAISEGTYEPTAPLNVAGKAITLEGVPHPSGGSPLTGISGSVHQSYIVLCHSDETSATRFENISFSGGTWGFYGLSGASPSFVDCRFSYNSSGGARFEGGSPTFDRCEFEYNNGAIGAGLTSSAHASPVLTECKFRYNFAEQAGGACYLSGGEPTFVDCDFRFNAASYYPGGGGIYAVNTSPIFQECAFVGNLRLGMYSVDSTPVLEDCVFEFNIEGGLYSTGGATTLSGCTFNANHNVTSAVRGGGCTIYGGDVTASACTFTANTAPYGGALYLRDATSISLNGCVFNSNSCDYNGGAVKAHGSGPLDITDCTFEANSAEQGAGIYVNSTSAESLNTLTSCVFNSNSCHDYGGAVYATGSGPLDITDCTFEANSAEQGAGIYVNSTSAESLNTLTSCVFTENHAVKFGGGVYGSSDTTLALTNCVFDVNSVGTFPDYSIGIDGSVLGGGMYIRGVTSLEGCTFSSNISGNFAGALYCWSTGDLTLRDCTFTGNQALTAGAIASFGPNLIDGCVFSNNSAELRVGGLYVGSSNVNVLQDTVLCGNIVGNLYGPFQDNGGNCVSNICQDVNGDGRPDCTDSPGDSALSVPDEYATLLLAVEAAGDGAVITIAPGVYLLTEQIDMLGKNLTFLGATSESGAPLSIIDGQSATRLFSCSPSFDDVGSGSVYENLVFRNGATTGHGGAIYNVAFPLTIVNCHFVNNTCDLYGGAVHSWSADSTIMGCYFEGNRAEFGGGFIQYSGGTCTVSDSTFTANSVTVGGAGVCVAYSTDDSRVTGCSFVENVGVYGGAYYTTGIVGILSDSTFTNNSATDEMGDGVGGALYHDDTVGAIENCVFTGNVAAVSGGAIQGDLDSGASSGTLEITTCSFTGNSAGTVGGAIDHDLTNPTLTGNTICGNSPDQMNGAWTSGGGNCIQAICQPEGCNTVTVCLDGSCDYSDIQSAIQAADGKVTVIAISAGTYVVSAPIDLLGKAITLRGAVDEAGNPLTIVDGQEKTGVFQCISGEGLETVLENIEVRNGSAHDGGGLYLENQSSVTLMNCVFRLNTATGFGGAIYGYNTSVEAYGCTFESNEAGYSGGAVTAYDVGTPFFSGCNFMSNSAEVEGGDVATYSNVFLVIESCFFTGSAAVERGGSLYINNSSASVDGCGIEACDAGSFGGGIYSTESTVSLVSSTVRDNVAGISGGGIFAQAGSPIMTETQVCGNSPNQMFGVTDQPNNCIAESCEDCDFDACPEDLDGNGVVNGGDLTLVLGNWGCTGDGCTADINDDGLVDGADLTLVLGAWGPCP